MVEEDEALNLTILSDIQEMLGSFSICNDQVSLIYHDFPAYISEQNANIRQDYALDDIDSFNAILKANNYTNTIYCEKNH